MIFINQFVGELFADVIDILRQLSDSHMLIAGSISQKWDNVRVLRGCQLQRTSGAKRLMTWGVFTAQTFLYLVRYARSQHVVFVTNPPMTMWMAPFFKWWYRCQYTAVIYDVYPDALIAAGILSPTSFIAKRWRSLNALTLKHADHIITLGEGMAATLRAQMPEGEKCHIAIIENWVDTNYFKPISKTDNPLVKEFELENSFIVMYAGSFGMTHGVMHFITCAEHMSVYPDIRFLLVGGGTEEKRIQRDIQKAALHNTMLLPYRPQERFRYLAAIPDVHVILLKSGTGKAILPSRVYTALAVGGVILASAEQDSDLAKLIERHQCGVIVKPDDPRALAGAILRLRQHPEETSLLKHNARRAAVRHYDRQLQCRKYLELFEKDETNF